MTFIRLANENDIESICLIDLIALREIERRSFIRNSVISGNCFVVVMDENVIGYGVLNYSFFSNAFIEMLYIAVEHRQSGAGSRLVKHMESICQTSKLFTSTNLSNLPMHSLLTKLGFILSGVIHHLDEGDPEIIYFKRLINDPF